MGIVGADIFAVMATQPLETNPYIGLNILNEMAETDRAIGVGKGAGNKNFARILGHIQGFSV